MRVTDVDWRAMFRGGAWEGTETEYVYDAHRIDVDLPPEVQPGLEAIELYLEAAQAAVLQLAQDLEAQEAGFA